MSEPLDRVMILSWGIAHPGRRSRRALAAMLRDVTPASTLCWVSRPDSIERDLEHHRPDLLVLHYHAKRTPAAPARFVHALNAYLADGGRVLALHATTASFKRDDSYAALIGGRFAGHGPVGPVSIRLPGRPDLAVELVDELYTHEIEADATVVASSSNGEPVAWVRTVGRGALAYASPGHRARTFRDPAYRRFVGELLARLEARE